MYYSSILTSSLVISPVDPGCNEFPPLECGLDFTDAAATKLNCTSDTDEYHPCEISQAYQLIPS